jgi:hypothetical protein
MSKKSIAERMGGKIDDGFYATIDAVKRQLRMTYGHAQRALREEFLNGNLERGRAGRRILYTSKQRGLF